MIYLEPPTISKPPVVAPGLIGATGPDILPGIPFGREDQLLTPAYWQWRCAVGDAEGHDYVARSGSLAEEVTFCLLGGFGVRMEVNDAFFRHLQQNEIFSSGSDKEEAHIRDLLEDRIDVEGKLQSYRFPKQRAYRIAKALKRLDQNDYSAMSDRQFRSALCDLSGVGPKTASWITRNWRGSETVAIIDIHVLRIGWYLGIFDLGAQLPKDYFGLEENFLRFADAIDVRPAVLDAVMWSDMRTFGSRLVSKELTI